MAGFAGLPKLAPVQAFNVSAWPTTIPPMPSASSDISLGTAASLAQALVQAPLRGGPSGKSSGKDSGKERSRATNPPEKIFVGGLPNSATEHSVRMFFSRYGSVTNVQLKYHDSGMFKGFGFVFFEDRRIADRVCALKGLQFDGKAIDCRKPMGASGPVDIGCKVFVGGIPKTITSEVVEGYFEEKFGKVASLQLKYDGDGNFRGFAFLTFQSPAAADLCCSTKGQMIDGKAIHCQLANPEEAVDASKRVFIGGLLKTIGEEEIRTQFSKFGKITNIDMKLNNLGKFRGFCFITFEDRVAAETVFKMQKEEAELYQNESGNSNAPLMFQRCITMSGTVGATLGSGSEELATARSGNKCTIFSKSDEDLLGFGALSGKADKYTPY